MALETKRLRQYLIFNVRPGEEITIGKDIIVRFNRAYGSDGSIAITAPSDIKCSKVEQPHRAA